MKYRLQAFLIHILLSVLVLATTLALVAFVWYPAPLFWADGGREVIQLIAFVDVVLGPLLTLIVYRKGKKSLKFDLSVIASIQVLALGYGVVTMYQQRPVFVAFAVDKFYTVTAAQVEADSPKKLAELKALMPHASNWVYVDVPRERSALEKLFVGQSKGELVLSLRTDLYQPLDRANMSKVLARRVDVLKTIEASKRYSKSEDKAALAAFLKQHGVSADEVAFIPFVARYQLMFAAYRLADASLIGYLEVRPDLLASWVN